MAQTNRERIEKGFEILRVGLTPFIERELKSKFGANWADQISYQQKRELDVQTGGKVRWDTQALLKAVFFNWNEAFHQTLGNFERSITSELMDTRNRWAHDETFTSDDALRGLDSMGRLLKAVSANEQAKEIDKIRLELQRLVFSEQTRQATRQSTTTIETKTKEGLKSWRDLVIPHRDVAKGQYMQAEFAADLGQVAKGEGSDEYRDPAEFFRRTFITDGLKNLLTVALQRLTGTGGEPVVELQTNFGGGKTHSMLALYHLFGGMDSSKLTGVEPLLKDAKLTKAPKAGRVVLVGTALSPGEVKTKPDGTKIRTIWGELAWQLGGKEGYKLIADSDKKSTSPGSDLLKELFDKYSPCLILIDEWVAYARQIYGKRDLPAGDFEAQTTFAQALTEAAKKSPKTMVVASVPSSKIEIGGEYGDIALETLKNVFVRVGTPWRPASADEGFEIVRRRLFEPIDADNCVARDTVIDGFYRMYQSSPSDFPSGCTDGDYKRKLTACYPIHPELFDKLYGEWSTLDKFQRTRGVLRLLAKVIHRLWTNNDKGLLIMPSSIPMDDPAVKSELIRYLPDVWEPIISEDVDGPNSLPFRLDSEFISTLGRFSASRRVSRTLYMGTAPGSTGKNPGIDDRFVKLGCSQPGEAQATFGDALRRVSERAKHIHQDGNRYWISTKSNLNRVAEDRANDYLHKKEELYAELMNRIRDERSKGEFKGVHPCPDSSDEVVDDTDVRLVILHPKYPHKKGQKDSEALKNAKTLLETRGSSPRLNRNALVFLAPDTQRLEELLNGLSMNMSWKSILDDEQSLNLDAFQRNQATAKLKDTEKTVEIRISETWSHILIPSLDDPASEVKWEELRVSGNEPLAKRVSAKLEGEYLYTEMGGIRLRMELDKYLWKEQDHLKVGQLLEWFPRYIYLPRVVNKSVIIDAVINGARTTSPDDTFGVAVGYDEAKKRYLGLKLGSGSVGSVDSTTLLVKPEVASKQIKAEEEEKKKGAFPETGQQTPTGDTQQKGKTSIGKVKAPEKKTTTFFASKILDESRLGRDAGKIAEEVLQHLSTLPGATVKVTLEIHVEVSAGISDDVVRTITENCNTLKFETHEFGKE